MPTMNRRSFLRASALGSMSLILPWGASSQARADTLRYNGPVFFHLHLAGGWDPTFSFDPKPSLSNLFGESDVRTFGEGAVPYANVPLTGYGVTIESVGEFMLAHGNDVTIINGIDVATINHGVAAQAMGSGHGIQDLPAFAALAAAKVSQQADVPLAFVGGGGYEFAAGLVPVTRRNSAVIAEVAYPNRLDPANETGLNLHESAYRKVMAARNAQLTKQLTRASLPRTKAALNALKDARARSQALATLVGLPNNPVRSRNVFSQLANAPQGRLDALDSALTHAEMAMQGFREGMSVSSTLEFGWFDTHCHHDLEHPVLLGQSLLIVRYVLQKAAEYGLRDRLFFLMSTDVGRTPNYNGCGKDDWNVCSALVSGPRSAISTLGRRVGATSDGHTPLLLTPTNLTGTAGANDAGATRLKPAHVHAALRSAFGITGTELDRRFPLTDMTAPLPLFGSA